MPPATRALTILLLALALAPAACKPYVREVPGSSTWENFPQDPKPGQTPDPKRENFGYTVELQRFDGPDRFNHAFDLIRELREQTQLVDLWTQDDGAAVAVNLGRFRTADQLDARTAESLVRNVVLNDKQPFRNARLSAITRGERAPTSPHDLRQHAGAPDYYSLEIAIFTPSHARYRAAAEQMAARLRDEGEEAYFYHGPNTSSVTVGYMHHDVAFTLLDQTWVYSEASNELKDKHPHILIDGETKDAVEGDPAQGQEPTKLIRVPSF